MTVSILIVNWNSKEYLYRCLNSIGSTCAELSPQVVVVDSGSHDGCREMIAASFPHVEFVQCRANLGFGRANNYGFSSVRGDALLLLNPDTELQSGSLSLLLRELDCLPHAGIVGPRILNSDRSLQTSCVRSRPTPLNQALDSNWLRTLLPASKLWGTWKAFHSETPVEVEALSGACMLLRSQTFQRVGGFSEEFFMYGEDLDLCFKVRRMRLKQYYVPAASVVHHGGKSSSHHVKRLPTVLMRAADYNVIRKWLGSGAAARYRFLLGISAVLRMTVLAGALLVSQGKARVQKSRSLFKWWVTLRWALCLEEWANHYGIENLASHRTHTTAPADRQRLIQQRNE